jgi:hypothetical protein
MISQIPNVEFYTAYHRRWDEIGASALERSDPHGIEGASP